MKAGMKAAWEGRRKGSLCSCRDGSRALRRPRARRFRTAVSWQLRRRDLHALLLAAGGSAHRLRAACFGVPRAVSAHRGSAPRGAHRGSAPGGAGPGEGIFVRLLATPSWHCAGKLCPRGLGQPVCWWQCTAQLRWRARRGVAQGLGHTCSRSPRAPPAGQGSHGGCWTPLCAQSRIVRKRSCKAGHW